MMGYRACLQWLLDNDDCDFLDSDREFGLSVSASLVADIFEKPDDKVRADLLRCREKSRANKETTP